MTDVQSLPLSFEKILRQVDDQRLTPLQLPYQLVVHVMECVAVVVPVLVQEADIVASRLQRHVEIVDNPWLVVL